MVRAKGDQLKVAMKMKLKVYNHKLTMRNKNLPVYLALLEHGHPLERFPSVAVLLLHHALFPGYPEGWRIIKLPLIMIAHASIRHQLQGDCVSSWLVLALAGFSLCHLAPVSSSPSCSVTSVHCKLLRGTNSEKPEL